MSQVGDLRRTCVPWDIPRHALEQTTQPLRKRGHVGLRVPDIVCTMSMSCCNIRASTRDVSWACVAASGPRMDENTRAHSKLRVKLCELQIVICLLGVLLIELLGQYRQRINLDC